MMITQPIFIIGCNPSGTTLLFRNLSMHPDLWSLYVESQDEFYRHWPIHPERGDRVVDPPTATARGALIRDLYRRAHNKERWRDTPVLGRLPTKLFQRPLGRLYRRPPIRFVEKTPANTLRIPLLVNVFPDARFLFIVRRGEDVVSSLMEGWKNWSGTPEGETWEFTKWHYLVPPGWREWIGQPLEEICTFQWTRATETAAADLQRYAADRHLVLRREDLIGGPEGEYARIAEFCDLRASPSFERVIASATDSSVHDRRLSSALRQVEAASPGGDSPHARGDRTAQRPVLRRPGDRMRGGNLVGAAGEAGREGGSSAIPRCFDGSEIGSPSLTLPSRSGP